MLRGMGSSGAAMLSCPRNMSRVVTSHNTTCQILPRYIASCVFLWYKVLSFLKVCRGAICVSFPRSFERVFLLLFDLFDDEVWKRCVGSFGRSAPRRGVLFCRLCIGQSRLRVALAHAANAPPRFWGGGRAVACRRVVSAQEARDYGGKCLFGRRQRTRVITFRHFLR